MSADLDTLTSGTWIQAEHVLLGTCRGIRAVQDVEVVMSTKATLDSDRTTRSDQQVDRAALIYQHKHRKSAVVTLHYITLHLLTWPK